MLRRLFTLASVVSLLLCAATAVLWVRSYWRQDRLEITTAKYPFVGIDDAAGERAYKARVNIVTVLSNYAKVDVDWERTGDTVDLFTENLPDWRKLYPEGPHARLEHDSAYPDAEHILFPNLHSGAILFDRFGFLVGNYSLNGISNFVQFTGQVVSVPAWVLTAVAAILPAIWLKSWLRSVLHRDHTLRCLTCGYDLRATPGRCPECGTPVFEKHKVTA